ncbi:MAG: hypothetical protein R2788_23495 [Saprospiraceae bacterium]
MVQHKRLLTESLINKSLEDCTHAQLADHHAAPGAAGFHSGKPAIALDAYREGGQVPKIHFPDGLNQWRIVHVPLSFFMMWSLWVGGSPVF